MVHSSQQQQKKRTGYEHVLNQPISSRAHPLLPKFFPKWKLEICLPTQTLHMNKILHSTRTEFEIGSGSVSIWNTGDHGKASTRWEKLIMTQLACLLSHPADIYIAAGMEHDGKMFFKGNCHQTKLPHSLSTWYGILGPEGCTRFQLNLRTSWIRAD